LDEEDFKAELEGPEEWDSEDEVDVKATKSDDAKVQWSSWNREVTHTMRVPTWGVSHPALAIVRTWMEARAMDAFREWMLKWYKRKTTREFFDWKRKDQAKKGAHGLSSVGNGNQCPEHTQWRQLQVEGSWSERVLVLVEEVVRRKVEGDGCCLGRN
jgi:hypothetical protein